MRPAISADRRRSTSGLSKHPWTCNLHFRSSCSGARPPTPRSLTSPFEAELPACHEWGLQSKFHDDERPISAPRHFIDTPPLPSHLVIFQDSHRLTDFRCSLTPLPCPYRGRITRGFLMAFGFWRCVLTTLPYRATAVQSFS